MIKRYCERSYWYNSYLRDEVKRLSLKALVISDGMKPDEIVDECLRLLSGDVEQ
jgi:hypothetical protein